MDKILCRTILVWHPCYCMCRRKDKIKFGYKIGEKQTVIFIVFYSVTCALKKKHPL